VSQTIFLSCCVHSPLNSPFPYQKISPKASLLAEFDVSGFLAHTSLTNGQKKKNITMISRDVSTFWCLRRCSSLCFLVLPRDFNAPRCSRCYARHFATMFSNFPIPGVDVLDSLSKHSGSLLARDRVWRRVLLNSRAYCFIACCV